MTFAKIAKMPFSLIIAVLQKCTAKIPPFRGGDLFLQLHTPLPPKSILQCIFAVTQNQGETDMPAPYYDDEQTMAGTGIRKT